MLSTRRHPVVLRISRRRLIDEVYSFCLESHNHIYNISVPDDFTCDSVLMDDAIEVMKQEKVLRCVAEHLDVSFLESNPISPPRQGKYKKIKKF